MKSHNKKLLLSLLMLGLILNGLAGQEDTSAEEARLERWASLSADTELTTVERLTAQTALVLEAGAESGWDNPRIWTWAKEVLNGWELTPANSRAREQYLEILKAAGAGLQDQENAVPFEVDLRRYLRRSLGLDLASSIEGTFYLYLAESWLRSGGGSEASTRRAEALLQQASDLLGADIPMDAVHIHLGDLALAVAGQESEVNGSRITRAVFHYRAATGLFGVREKYLARANEALSQLLDPEMDLQIINRYLPLNDIRLTVRSRNIPFLEVELVPVTSMGEIDGSDFETMLQQWSDLDYRPEQAMFSQRFPIRTRNPYDWTETQLALGETYPEGWYGLRILSGELEVRQLLLVSSLEVVALTRKSGAVSVWVADVETGLPFPGASVQVFDESGIGATAVTGLDGQATVPDSMNWKELHVLAGSTPGFIRRSSEETEDSNIPWVVAGSQVVLPGQTLHFSLFGLDPEFPGFVQGDLKVLFPDGSESFVDIEEPASPYLSSKVDLPDNLAASGPLYLQFPDGHCIYLSHAATGGSLPVKVRFAGERIWGRSNIFYNSTAIEVRLDADEQGWDKLPAYIRVVVSLLDRSRFIEGSEKFEPGQSEFLLERIYSLEEARNEDIVLELSGLGENASELPIRVDVLSLDGRETYGSGHAISMGYRSLVDLRVSEKIIKEGETMQVLLDYGDSSRMLMRLYDGDLVLFRETWQSRYIHRKRGNLISENDYEMLPDRSLLGAAKTDYRLAEQGFVREEVQRIPVKAASSRAEVPIQFDRPGYYRIAFESPEPELRPVYQEGSLEVWVLPESGDLKAFRTVEPRAIIEENDAGGYEALVLMDRAEVSVLLDFEHEDGSVHTAMLQPGVPALSYSYFPETDSPLRSCRYFIVGDRRIDYLWDRIRRESKVSWDIGAGQLLGVNPGTAFNWTLSCQGKLEGGPVFWTFLPSEVTPFMRRRINWQTQYQETYRQGKSIPADFFEQTFALYDPLDSPETILANQADSTGILSVLDFLALYPEVRELQSNQSYSGPLNVMENGAVDSSLNLTGFYPSSAGRWHLGVFAQTATGEISTEQWFLSTELPIRSQFGGPEFLRVGDVADLRLQLENTTNDVVDLNVQISGIDPVAVSFSEDELTVPLRGNATEKVFFPVVAERPGESRLEVKSTSQLLSVVSQHSLVVQEPRPLSDWEFHSVPPQSGLWQKNLSFEDWERGDFMVASGIGSLILEIWPLVRAAQGEGESVFTATGDWALTRMIDRQGLDPEGQPENAESILTTLLETRQNPDGGWSWTEGQASDPWISALVFWTLEIFQKQEAETFAEIKGRAESFLSKVLLSDEGTVEEKIFALRALSAKALRGIDTRPSRLQARIFLEFLYQREQLQQGELALLLEIAQAYGFKEEVILLSSELRQLIRSGGNSPGTDFLTESLVYHALSDDQALLTAGFDGGLERMLRALSGAGPRRGWDHVAGMLNLMSAYYWKGDFNVDGQIRMVLNGGDPVDIILDPNSESAALSRSPMDQDSLNDFSIEVDTAFALSPVIFAFIGKPHSKAEAPAFPGYDMQSFREFEELTLLRGTRQRLVQVDPSQARLIDEELYRVRILIEADSDRPYAEFCFPVPAGLILDDSGVDHAWEPFPAEEAIEGEVSVFQEVPSDSYCFRYRLEPFERGIHSIELPLRVKWSGRYSWPDGLLVLPKSGETYRLATPDELEIVPGKED